MKPHDTAVHPVDDGHDLSAVLTFRGVTVTITLRDREYADLSGTDPNTVLVLVDTSETPTNLSVQINDGPTIEGFIR